MTQGSEPAETAAPTSPLDHGGDPAEAAAPTSALDHSQIAFGLTVISKGLEVNTATLARMTEHTKDQAGRLAQLADHVQEQNHRVDTLEGAELRRQERSEIAKEMSDRTIRWLGIAIASAAVAIGAVTVAQ